MQKTFNSKQLSLVGLNLQAVINIKDLPQELKLQLSKHTDYLSHYTQLILIGHGGKALWENVKAWQTLSNKANKSGKTDKNNKVRENPIDCFSAEQTEKHFKQCFSSNDFELIFPFSKCLPNSGPIGLQTLGELVGWHHTSPFRVGINHEWGSWFAYRAVVLAKSDYRVILKTDALKTDSPCSSCDIKPCVSSCPPNALENGELSLQLCMDYRKLDNSLCKDRCIARMSCPVAPKEQYDLEQIQYHYSLSMKMIESIHI
jgi:epoxyqueuosine reductase